MNSPKVGDQVKVVSCGQEILSGVLVSLHDDSDEYIGNVEEWARVRVGPSDERVFRRHISLAGVTGGWSPQGAGLRREHPSVHIVTDLPSATKGGAA